MAELLDPSKVNYVAVPAAQPKPTPRTDGGPQGVDRLRNPQSRQPTRPTFITRSGPPILLLPHDSNPAPAQQPVRQRRGVPVRLSADVADLYRAIADDPRDDARWLIAADALDEHGKEATAALFRQMGAAEKMKGILGGSYRWYDAVPQHPGQGDWHGLETGGTVAGLPMSIRHGDHFSVVVPSHVKDFWGYRPGVAFLAPDEARRIEAEMDHKQPERMAAAPAPAGGILSRGIFYKGGERIPSVPPTPPPALAAPRPRTRLRDALRRPSARLARPRLDPAIVDGLRGVGEDAAPWHVFADHVEEGGMPELAAAMRGEPIQGHQINWNPGESWERPSPLMASGFVSWAGPGGAKMYHDLHYYPEHGVATVRVKPYTTPRVSEHGNPERTTVLRGHDAIARLAAEVEQNQLEDGEGDWAEEFARVKNEAARRTGADHAQGQ